MTNPPTTRAPRALITGGSRGIGLALAKRLSEQGWEVLATESKVRMAVVSTSSVRWVQCDLRQREAPDVLIATLQDEPLDLLVNNAAVGDVASSIEDLNRDEFVDAFRVNVEAPLFVTQALLRNLRAARGTVINMCSDLACFEKARDAASYPYPISKGALRFATLRMARDLEPDIRVIALHPGSVQTDMGGPNAEISAEECAARIAKLIDRRDRVPTGVLIDAFGTPLPA